MKYIFYDRQDRWTGLMARQRLYLATISTRDTLTFMSSGATTSAGLFQMVQQIRKGFSTCGQPKGFTLHSASTLCDLEERTFNDEGIHDLTFLYFLSFWLYFFIKNVFLFFFYSCFYISSEKGTTRILIDFKNLINNLIYIYLIWEINQFVCKMEVLKVVGKFMRLECCEVLWYIDVWMKQPTADLSHFECAAQ